jgi:uncharacterized protein YneF (UPF0154 family)
MPDIQIAMLVFVVLVVGIGGGWFIYETYRDEEK